MEEVKIEKGVPMPPDWADILAGMDIGDSFLTSSPPATFYAAARKSKTKISIKKMDGGKLRIWRVE